MTKTSSSAALESPLRCLEPSDFSPPASAQLGWRRKRKAIKCGPELITEHLAEAAKFERLAKYENNPALKEQLLKQAAAYYKLAEERAHAGAANPAQAPGGLAPERTIHEYPGW